MDGKKIGVRDKTFDVVKFIAMFMVVYWHVMSYRPSFELSSRPSYAANFIIAVNMPLFFMVSGFFSRNLHESRNWPKLVRRLMAYFWPMLTFSLAFAIVDSIVYNRYSICNVPLWWLKKILFCHWFFYALAACDAITFIAFKFGRTTVRILLLCLIAFALCMVVSGKIWYSVRIVAMAPFYWFGLVCLRRILEMRHAPLIFVSGVFVMVFVTFFAGNIATNGLAFYWDSVDVWHLQFVKVLNMLVRFIVGTLGSIAIIVAVRFLCRRFRFVGLFSSLGEETLGIYFLQGAMISCISNRFVELDAGVLTVF